MGKASKANTGGAPVAAPATLYTLNGKYTGRQGTKYGSNGTHSTFAALAAVAQANGGTLTYAQAQAACKANGDPGFAAYALRRKYLLPVQV
jgi:hypothetical protein